MSRCFFFGGREEFLESVNIDSGSSHTFHVPPGRYLLRFAAPTGQECWVQEVELSSGPVEVPYNAAQSNCAE